jgi:hypothetical protein
MNSMPKEWLQADSAVTHYPMVDGFTRLMKEGDYCKIDEYLRNAKPSEMSELSMIGLLRTTFAARKKLRQWHQTRDRVARVIDSPQTNLRGLFND